MKIIKKGSDSDFSCPKERISEAAVNPSKVVYFIIHVKDFVYLVVDYKHYEDTFYRFQNFFTFSML